MFGLTTFFSYFQMGRKHPTENHQINFQEKNTSENFAGPADGSMEKIEDKVKVFFKKINPLLNSSKSKKNQIHFLTLSNDILSLIFSNLDSVGWNVLSRTNRQMRTISKQTKIYETVIKNWDARTLKECRVMEASKYFNQEEAIQQVTKIDKKQTNFSFSNLPWDDERWPKSIECLNSEYQGSKSEQTFFVVIDKEILGYIQKRGDTIFRLAVHFYCDKFNGEIERKLILELMKKMKPKNLYVKFSFGMFPGTTAIEFCKSFKKYNVNVDVTQRSGDMEIHHLISFNLRTFQENPNTL